MSNIADTQTPTNDPAEQAAIEREREQAAGTKGITEPVGNEGDGKADETVERTVAKVDETVKKTKK